MINAEKYKDELKSLNDADKLWHTAFDKHNMTFDSCLNVKCENCAFDSKKDCNNGRYNWLLSEYKKPIEVSKLEYEFLKWSEKEGHKYIVRDKINHLFIFKDAPIKRENCWVPESSYCSIALFDNLFKFIKQEDEEPYSINDILKNCRMISDNIVIHKIVDE